MNQQYKTGIRLCRYKPCNHPRREINLDKDDYKVDGKKYYHSDCYEIMESGKWKGKTYQEDLRELGKVWYYKIDKHADWDQLKTIYDDFLMLGYESKYIVFALKYVIKYGFSLNYPEGFKYYLVRKDIKNAYAKERAKLHHVDLYGFRANKEDNSPKFNAKRNNKGFSSILK